MGDWRRDRKPAEPDGRPLCALRGRLPAYRRRRADRRFPHGDRQALGVGVIGLGLLVGLPSGCGETAVLVGASMAVLAAAGFAAVTLIGSRPVPGLDDL